MVDLGTDEPLLEDNVLSEKQRNPRSLRRFFNLSNITILLLLILSVVIIVRDVSHQKNPALFHQAVFSPALEAVEYKIVVFAPFGEPSIYSDPPTYEGDQAWEALYNNIGISWVDAETASKLPNQTTQIEGSDKYVVGLDVFHQLHCLNALRKLLYPGRYPMQHNASKEDHIMHIDHCIQSLRESLTCTADISTIFWSWDEAAQKNLPNAHTTHTCRDFGKLQEWARERRVDTLPNAGLAVHEGS
ncbi:hypothetical protein BJX70DRAFT_352466 [Aspergillus crustosus]